MTIAKIFGNPHSDWINGGYFHVWALNSGALVSQQEFPEMVWIDMETSGLDEEQDIPLELGIILTDRVGRIMPNGVAVWRIFDYERTSVQHVQDVCHPLVNEMHTKNGLWGELKAATAGPDANRLDPVCVEADAEAWLKARCRGVEDWNGEKKAPLSGSSPQFDRKFLAKHLPRLHNWFHYRNGADVSATRNLQRLLAPGLAEPEKMEVHRPIPDLVDSLHLYRHQLYTFLKISEEARKML